MRPRGFTLAETLIALLLGLVLLGAIVATLASGRQTHADNEHLARAQEAARTALALLAGEARNAGHYGLAWPGRRSRAPRPRGRTNPQGSQSPDAAFPHWRSISQHRWPPQMVVTRSMPHACSAARPAPRVVRPPAAIR